MKNLRISRKDPSKILKIIDEPQTSRLNQHFDFNQQAISISVQRPNSNKHIKQYSYRQDTAKSSSKQSFKPIHFGSLSTNKRTSKLLNRSQEIVKSDNQKSHLQRSSGEMKSKHDMSPYIRRYKFKQSQKSLNFNSVTCNERHKVLRVSQQLSHKIRRYSNSKQSSEQQQGDERQEDKLLISARNLLKQGEYRKSLYVLKSLLKNHPHNAEGLFLSGVSWYHLDDRVKVISMIELLLSQNPGYSEDSYKLLAVSYFKSLDFDKSLLYLRECHHYFPTESESYQIEAKIQVKQKNWIQALKCYERACQFNQQNNYLLQIGNCLYELEQYEQALKYFTVFSESQPHTEGLFFKMIKIQQKCGKYQELLELFEKDKDLVPKLQNKQAQQLYYLAAYSTYKLQLYEKGLTFIREGLELTEQPVRFTKLLLMTKIQERDIYEGYRLIEQINQEPQLRVIMYFIEGVINLMRRNYNEGIVFLQSIKKDLGFDYEFQKNSDKPLNLGQDVEDEFLSQLRKIYPMFLSYGYFNVSQFYISRLLITLQKKIGVPEYFELGFAYNQAMNEGIICHCERRFTEAEKYFIQAYEQASFKLQPPFSLALNYLQIMVEQQEPSEKQIFLKKAQIFFEKCESILGKSKTNAAASVFYFHSLLYGYNQDWKSGLGSIEQSLQRSQDHYWRYFYLRGMFLACIHNFPQAIRDLNAAVSLSEGNRPQCFLLRSRCLQIEGQGSDAFKDLQEYIALKPDDPQIHQYAGQLLFQNGAFQDALMAFSHQPIPEIPNNYDIFLTQSKSLFLLGRFKQAQEVMNKAYQLKSSEQTLFDIKILQLLDIMIYKPLEQVRQAFISHFSQKRHLGRIFKLPDYYVFMSICDLRAGQPENALISFQKAIFEKTKELGKSDDEDESELLQIQTEIDTFKNQMRYNMVLCNLLLQDWKQAMDICALIKIPLEQSYYSDFVNFRKFINRENNTYKKEEVFPSRNKLSNHLQKLKITMGKGQSQKFFFLKLCIPFPKVEPPQIFPCFDRKLLERVSVLNVERKPEAPWILKQNNSIRFTEKIETFSRLQLQDSSFQSSGSYQLISIDQSHLSHSSSSRRLHSLGNNNGAQV